MWGRGVEKGVVLAFIDVVGWLDWSGRQICC